MNLLNPLTRIVFRWKPGLFVHFRVQLCYGCGGLFFFFRNNPDLGQSGLFWRPHIFSKQVMLFHFKEGDVAFLLGSWRKGREPFPAQPRSRGPNNRPQSAAFLTDTRRSFVLLLLCEDGGGSSRRAPPVTLSPCPLCKWQPDDATDDNESVSVPLLPRPGGNLITVLPTTPFLHLS